MAKGLWGSVAKNSSEVQKKGVRYYGEDEGDFHDNFVDLNPDWAKNRHEKAVSRAADILSKIKIQL